MRMAEEHATPAFASLGMRYGLTSHELADVARALLGGRPDDEVAAAVHARHAERLPKEHASAAVAAVGRLVATRRAEVEAWLDEVGG